MRFVEISEGLCISTDKVVTVRSIGPLMSEVSMLDGSYHTANFPYLALLEILEDGSENQIMVQTQQSLVH